MVKTDKNSAVFILYTLWEWGIIRNLYSSKWEGKTLEQMNELYKWRQSKKCRYGWKKIREILFWMKLIKCESNKEIKKTEEVQQMRKKSGMRKTDKSVKDK